MESAIAANPVHDHGPCRTLRELILAHALQDGFGRDRNWQKGACIWRSDDPTDSLYLLKRGRVVIVDGDKGKTLATIVEGDAFGDVCFRSQARKTTARTLTSCEAQKYVYSDLLTRVAMDADLLHDVVHAFCTRLSSADLRIAVLAHRGAQERVGTLLLKLAETRAAARNGHESLVPIKHEEISHLAAMSRSHVTVTMGRFRKLGLVRYSRNEPLKVNTLALSKFVEGRVAPEHH
jgi:CRP-like cAMP-binding protein